MSTTEFNALARTAEVRLAHMQRVAADLSTRIQRARIEIRHGRRLRHANRMFHMMGKDIGPVWVLTADDRIEWRDA